VDEDDEIKTSKPIPSRKGKEREIPSDSVSSSSEESDNEEESVPQPEQTLRRSQRQPKPRYPKDSIYGKKSGAEVQKMKTSEWKELVGEGSSVPTKSMATKVPASLPQRDQTPEPPSDEERNQSDVEVEEELFINDEGVLTARVCREGGVEAINFLLTKAVSPTAMVSTEKTPKEWSYRDLARLNPQELELWRNACNEELDALQRRKVYELVDRPTGRKIIKNRWVFNVKSDRRRKARLVAKGFSQVEGLDFDQIFSPVVRFETVRLILALAALKDWKISGLDVKSAYHSGHWGKIQVRICLEYVWIRLNILAIF
jgi:hypothetical protein